MSFVPLDLLICPDCRTPLGREGGRTLLCPACRRSFDGDAGFADLLPREDAPQGVERRTLASFARQWRTYGSLPRIFGKDPRAMAANLVGPRLSRSVDEAWYRGRRVLDAGCGHGRYLEAFAGMGAEVVGLDYGMDARRAAAIPERPDVSLVRGSVLRLPFADARFDLVFCDGVIHHTPDPRGAWRELARVVRPGGALYVWVYPREGRLRETVFGAARAVTTRLPGPAVRWLSFALAPLTIGVRSYSGTTFGRATWAECAQVVHDWIAPALQSHHDYEELAGWAGETGFVRMECLPVPTGITAWKRASESA